MLVAKTLGLFFGILAMIGTSMWLPESGWLTRLGFLFWYLTIGSMIGLMGVLDWHPVFDVRLPWWVRGPFIGAWMNFVLVFFAYDLTAEFMQVVEDYFGLALSPFWFALEGAVVGRIIGWASTALGGEGPAVLENEGRY